MMSYSINICHKVGWKGGGIKCMCVREREGERKFTPQLDGEEEMRLCIYK